MSDSSPTPEPFRIEPIFSPRIWGTRSLAPLFPEKANLDQPIGEAWLTGVECRISGGPFAGKTLGEAWGEMNSAWRGLDFEGEPDFPLLLKFIFPKDKLSIQVHPDDAYAAVHEKAAGGRGKTEMWHIVSADAGARLLAGLKPGVTRQVFCDAIVGGELENLFQSHDVRAGDTFFIPAGTPHTIGPDMIVCEVQEYSDLTYRVYDYGRVDSNGRPRELHVEKALEVMNFKSEKIGKVTPTGTAGHATEGWERLVDCAYFEAMRFGTNGPIRFDLVQERPAAFKLWVFLQGAGSVEWSCHPYERFTQNHGGFSYRAGECWFIPAAFGSHRFRTETKTSVLIATPHNPKLASTKNDHGE